MCEEFKVFITFNQTEDIDIWSSQPQTSVIINDDESKEGTILLNDKIER